MRRVIITIVLLFSCFLAGAQGRSQLDSLRYILPEFCQGTVIFGDKSVSRGVLNISPLDQTVYCISAGGDTLSVAGSSDIISVNASGRSFVRWQESFVEIAVVDGNTGVGIIRTTSKVNNAKPGAYGMASGASSTRTYSVNPSTGTFRDSIMDDPRNYVYRQFPCLCKDGRCLPVSRKSFERLFPELKAYIESVWSDRNIDITDTGSVIGFYRELLQK